MSDTEFKNLFEAAQKGDIKSLETLIDMFTPSIRKQSFVNGKLDSDCQQELTLRLINCIRNFNFDTKKDISDYLNIDDE
ncbi:helix-turn-helix domain-containing protein [Brassicibacter mesophilus]|uniref:helix-turn-helix domain-containing protein n=1 Tax=Brassicibacter mesophilus TaxID=745119 RepID=UPI003D1E2BC6